MSIHGRKKAVKRKFDKNKIPAEIFFCSLSDKRRKVQEISMMEFYYKYPIFWLIFDRKLYASSLRDDISVLDEAGTDIGKSTLGNQL